MSTLLSFDVDFYFSFEMQQVYLQNVDWDVKSSKQQF